MFDFENDDWPDGMRITYKMIKWCFLDAAFSLCRSCYPNKKVLNKSLHYPIGNQSEYAWAYEQCEGLCSKPIELLMYEVVALILFAGRNESFDKMCRTRVSEILKDRDLALMLKDLPQTEKNEFEHDLKLLGLMG